MKREAEPTEEQPEAKKATGFGGAAVGGCSWSTGGASFGSLTSSGGGGTSSEGGGARASVAGGVGTSAAGRKETVQSRYGSILLLPIDSIDVSARFVHTGRWLTNYRVGAFEVLDPNGCFWDDMYDSFGKRTSRRRAEAAAGGSKTDVCKWCGVRFHADYNFACRRHCSEFDGASLGEGCHVEPAHEAA